MGQIKTHKEIGKERERYLMCESDTYKMVVVGIIEQAKTDYVRSVKNKIKFESTHDLENLTKAERIKQLNIYYEIADCKSFFLGRWFKALCGNAPDNTGEKLLKKLDQLIKDEMN